MTFRSLVAGGFFSSDPTDTHVKRSIRTNNPGALNISKWQKTFPGFYGVTPPDGAGNVTSIYNTPEHGIAAWFHLLTVRYGYDEINPTPPLAKIARRYAGVNSDDDPAVKGYVKGWRKFSGNQLDKDSTILLSDDSQVLVLAHGMFGHEIGSATPLHDDQILEALRLKRTNTLPPT